MAGGDHSGTYTNSESLAGVKDETVEEVVEITLFFIFN
jgi:hypothetical protein